MNLMRNNRVLDDHYFQVVTIKTNESPITSVSLKVAAHEMASSAVLMFMLVHVFVLVSTNKVD